MRIGYGNKVVEASNLYGRLSDMDKSNMVVNVRVPRNLSSTNALQFVEEINDLPESELYEFDFTDLSWIDPFGLLYVSKALRDFLDDRSRAYGASCKAINFESRTYEAHMGFFQCFGLDYGNHPGDAPGSIHYLPITELNIDDLYREARGSGQALGQVISEKSERLASVLAQNDEGVLFDAIAYSIREIVRNSAEHSNGINVRYCAQHWPQKSRVQIAILDDGQGVKQSLTRNPFVECESDSDALKLAVLPAVSGKMYEGVEIRPYDVWQNSGYGLYMLSRICRDAGSLFIKSNSGSLEMLRGRHEAHEGFGLNGTSVRIQLDYRLLGDLEEKLARFADEASEHAERIRGTRAIEASLASLMLRADEGEE